MNVTIRKAITGDLQTLMDINYASFEANVTYDKYFNMNWFQSDDARECFLEEITEKGNHTIIADVDGKPVGFLVLRPKRFLYRTVKMIELDILAVIPEYQSKRIGVALMDAAKIWAKEQGYHTIYATPYIKNERAIEFYKREGFSPIDMSLELTL
jgi:GNAT superfamily N-acetyltransferase